MTTVLMFVVGTAIIAGFIWVMATGNIRVNPVIWDNNVCHEYWYVYHGQGNVAQNIWDGPNPPGPPPGQGFVPPPPIPPGWCWGLFLPSPCP